jgi:hypothetical protein
VVAHSTIPSDGGDPPMEVTATTEDRHGLDSGVTTMTLMSESTNVWPAAARLERAFCARGRLVEIS